MALCSTQKPYSMRPKMPINVARQKIATLQTFATKNSSDIYRNTKFLTWYKFMSNEFLNLTPYFPMRYSLSDS